MLAFEKYHGVSTKLTMIRLKSSLSVDKLIQCLQLVLNPQRENQIIHSTKIVFTT